MVRTVHMNIFYKMDLQISDPESGLLTKNKNVGLQTKWTIQCWDPTWTFEVVSKTEMISKYILDHSWVIPAQFPYTHILKINLNRVTGQFVLTSVSLTGIGYYPSATCRSSTPLPFCFRCSSVRQLHTHGEACAWTMWIQSEEHVCLPKALGLQIALGH